MPSGFWPAVENNLHMRHLCSAAVADQVSIYSARQLQLVLVLLQLHMLLMLHPSHAAACRRVEAVANFSGTRS
jgi:hypothetical protein